MGKKGTYISFIIALFLILIPFIPLVSASPFGYDTEEGITIQTINNNTYYINGSNINATSTTCAGTDKFSAYNNATGVFTCSTDQNGTGISWAEAINGTLFSQADWNTNYTTNDPIWRSFSLNYSDYLTIRNYALNATGITWGEATNGTLAELSTILGFNYYNSTTAPIYLNDTFAGNYSDYLTTRNYALNATGISWAEATNGTLFTQALWNTNYTANNDAWLNTTNLTYHAYNDTGLIVDYNATGLIRDDNATGLIANWSNIISVSDTFANNYSDYLVIRAYALNDSLWSLNYSDYLTTRNYALNATGITWGEATNGTLAELSTILGFNYYNSTTAPIYLNDTFAGNYSDYLTTRNYALNATGISWGEATNGTLAELSTILGFNYYNSTTAPIYLNDTFAGNYSDYLTTKAYALNATGISWSEATNGTLFTQALWNTNYTANNDAWLNTTNLTYHAFNDTGLIIDYNATGLIRDDNATGLIANWSNIISTTDTFANNYSDYLTIRNYALNDSLWSSNYSDYLTTRNYALNATGITWGEATNGTLYLANNPFGFYNSTNPPTLDVIGNPDDNQTFTMGDNIIAFRYTAPTPAGDFAGAFEIEATGGFSGDLLHLHQHSGNPSSVNLLKLEADDVDVIPIEIISANPLAINVSSGNISIISGFYEGDGRFLTNINTTNFTYDAYNSSGLIRDWNATGDITDENATGLIANWSSIISTTDTFANNYSDYLTIRSYALNDSLWSSNYSDYLTIRNYALNATGITWSEAVNGTLFTQAEYDTNYTANDPIYRSWNLNYSDYLTIRDYALNATGISWGDATNGTLLSQADFDANYTDWNTTGYIIDWNASSHIIDWNATGDIAGWNATGFIANWTNIITSTTNIFTANQNLSDNNMTNVQCINFQNGASWCGI